MRGKISILGSTGSIGTQALDVCEKLKIHPVALCANNNRKMLEEQARRWKPALAVLYDEEQARQLKTALADTDVRVAAGMEGLIEAATMPQADMPLVAVSGMIGLQPTLAAIDAGKDIALANKETLVCAGELVINRAKKKHVRILPVDSEHSAIFQCLECSRNPKEELRRILLTASGGPFFHKTREELYRVTPRQALRHPNWNMGSKITIDSATLMNKGLELIEAMWLFDVLPEDITVLVHRESIIHSMVEYLDGAVIAQMGTPDMRLPIAYAFTYPERRTFGGKTIDFTELESLHFEKPDMKTFGCLALAIRAAKRGGTAGAVLNGANEAAVPLFLQEKISFLQIEELVGLAVDTISIKEKYTLQDVLNADQAARELVVAHAGDCTL